MVEESIREISSPLLPLQRQFPVPSSRWLFVMYNTVRRYEMVILLIWLFQDDVSTDDMTTASVI